MGVRQDAARSLTPWHHGDRRLSNDQDGGSVWGRPHTTTTRTNEYPEHRKADKRRKPNLGTDTAAEGSQKEKTEPSSVIMSGRNAVDGPLASIDSVHFVNLQDRCANNNW